MQGETRYQPSADQLAIASEIDASLGALLPLSRLHSSHEENAGTWAGLEEIGIFGISVAEDRGGSGLGAAEEALIVMGLGRRLASPAVFATLAAAHAASCAFPPTQPGRRVAAGYRREDRTIIVRESAANLFLIRTGEGADLYDVDAFTATKIDTGHWQATLCSATASTSPIAHVDSTGILRLRLIDAAALVGIAEGALEMAVAYAGIREQFGRPIGMFQAVKHQCADMAIAARCARDQASFAAVAVDEGREDAELQVECALSVAGSAAVGNSGKNIQIHGGIGFSDEADPHLFLKRAQLSIAVAGGLEAANGRIANMKSGW